MKIFKKTVLLFILLITTINLFCNSNNTQHVNAQVSFGKHVTVVVLLSSFDNAYMSLVRQNLEKIQKDNKGMIEFIFFDGKRNQDIQNEALDSILETNFDLLLANLVDVSSNNVESLINKVHQKNIPVILFNVAPVETASIKSYPKAVIIATDAEQSGILEGKLVINEWNNNKVSIDKNEDNILQYVMLASKDNNTLNTARTKFSVSSINDAGIQTQELALKTSDETQESAKEAIESVLLSYGDKIEAIIANDDTLAIGAVKALQKYGYNSGRKSVPVFGINGIPEAIDLINRGSMASTVIQDAPAMAEALYKVGANLVFNKNPLNNTNYNFDETGVIIKMPYKEYKKTRDR
jgi:methyl-galactoside transport system substrate-binding protein